MLAELRLALRALGRAPGFTLAAVLCLALGVGANTAVFGAVRAVLLHPVATPDVGRLVVVREDWVGIKLKDTQIAPPEVFDLAARRDLFANVAGYLGGAFVLSEGGGSTRYRGARTLGDFFGTFHVRPQLGRFYTPDDSRGGRHHVAVLSDGFWRERFGADPGVLGRPLRLNDVTYTVVGVLPPEFRYPRWAQILTPDPVDSTVDQMRGDLMVTAVARLRDGVTFDQAAAALGGEGRAWRDRFPRNKYKEWDMRLRLRPFVEFDAGQLRPVLLVLLGAVGLVLLVASANLASLQLVRVTGRARELAVRGALGAGRARLARQPLAEACVIAAAGGASGVALGWGLTRLFVRLAPVDQLALQQLRLDGPVLATTTVVAVAAALLAGAVPALRSARADVRGALAEGTRGTSAGPGRHRALRAVVAAQVALSLALLLGTGLLLRSLGRMLDVPLGFESTRVTTARVVLSSDRARQPGAANAFYAALADALRATPGVEQVALAGADPLGQSGSTQYRVVGRDTTAQPVPPHGASNIVGSDYFRLLRIPLLRGRVFGPGDGDMPPGANPADTTPRSRPVIVDELFARREFPGGDPLGQRIVYGGTYGVIVGVVGRVRQGAAQDSLTPMLYYDYRPFAAGGMTVLVRSRLGDDAAARAIRRAVAAVDPRVPVYDAATLPELVRRTTGARRFGVTVLGGLAALALALAALGIYGVLAYVVAQRTREMGVRTALGARARDVAALVLRDGVRLAGTGLAGGVLLFLAGGRVLSSQLYGVGARDPVTIVVSAALLGTVALFASWIPARRAARVDPVEALRAE